MAGDVMRRLPVFATVIAVTAALASTGVGALETSTAAATSRPALPAGGSPALAALGSLPGDPYAGVPGSTGVHRTEVEPSLAAHRGTLVAAFQAGRHRVGGADNIGFGRSTNNGRSWKGSFLPGLTKVAGGPFDVASDPSVPYDAKHRAWLGGSVDGTLTRPVAVSISRSTNDGRTFGSPITAATGPGVVDKDWVSCDNNLRTSRFAGTCYLTWEDAISHQVFMQRSTDGGVTWSAPVAPTGPATGLGGEPVVQPDGRVVVPYVGPKSLRAFVSVDGGVIWTPSVRIDKLHEHNFGITLRTSATPSAGIAADGRMFVAWQGCASGPVCRTDQVLLSTSTSGQTWARPFSVPTGAADATDSIAPTIAVKGRGSKTSVALTYYRDSRRGCAVPCTLTAETVTSSDAGQHWSEPHVMAAGIDHPLACELARPDVRGLPR
jgi:hypothetical protein